jgi:hypothetical protein
MPFKFRSLLKVGAFIISITILCDNIRRELYREYSNCLAFGKTFGDIAYPNQNSIKQEQRRIICLVKQSFKALNSNLSGLNKELSKINGDKIKLKKVPLNNLDKEMKSFFSSKIFTTDNDDIIKHLLNSFDAYINRKIQPAHDSVKEAGVNLQREMNFFEIHKVNHKYRKKVCEALDLYLIGYKSTSLIVLGKIFEEIFVKYLWKLKKNKKIKLTKNEILKMSFENILGFMKSNKFINYKDWLILSKIRTDRNRSAHPVIHKLQKETESEAQSTLKLALGLINKFYEKIK